MGNKNSVIVSPKGEGSAPLQCSSADGMSERLCPANNDCVYPPEHESKRQRSRSLTPLRGVRDDTSSARRIRLPRAASILRKAMAHLEEMPKYSFASFKRSASVITPYSMRGFLPGASK